MLKKLILISLILSILPLVYAVEMNDTLVSNTITNYSFYMNNTIYFDQLIVSDEGRIEIYNITSNQTHIPILFNINNTYESIIDFYGLNKALITKSDGSVGCSNVETCSGNQNISIPINGWIKVYDNYNVETGTTPSDPRPNDPVSSGTSGTGTNQSTILNSTLTSPVIFSLSGLTNALIFNNSNNVLASSNINDNDGEINLTIRGDEIIYILNNYEKSESYTRYLDPIWFSSSSSTSKHIASNLSDSINVSVYINSPQASKVITSNGQTFIIPSNSGNPVELNNVLITSGNTILTIENNKQIQGICEKGGISLFDSATLMGVILTLLLLSGVIAILVGVFTNQIDLDKEKQHIDLQSILIGVMTIGLTYIILVTVTYVFSSAYCGTLGV